MIDNHNNHDDKLKCPNNVSKDEERREEMDEMNNLTDVWVVMDVDGWFNCNTHHSSRKPQRRHLNQKITRNLRIHMFSHNNKQFTRDSL